MKFALNAVFVVFCVVVAKNEETEEHKSVRSHRGKLNEAKVEHAKEHGLHRLSDLSTLDSIRKTQAHDLQKAQTLR